MSTKLARGTFVIVGWILLFTTSIVMADPLDDCVRHEMETGGIPGVSVAVERDGQLVLSRNYGVEDVASKERVTAHTLFQAASISKPLTALGAMVLVEQGRLPLDGDVNDLLKSWKIPANDFTRDSKVTIRRILSHSAGFTVHGFVGYRPEQAVPSLTQVLDGAKPANSAPVRVEFIPGSKEQYSGGGYEVLQQLLVDFTREPFPQFMKTVVLQPLGMDHSTFEQPLPAALANVAASGYYLNGKPLPCRWNIYPEMAAAGLWSTPEDLCRFISALQKAWIGETGGIVTPAAAKTMLTRVVGNSGLGLRLSPDGKRFWHNGRTIGFDSLMFGSAHLGGAVMINRNVNGAPPRGSCRKPRRLPGNPASIPGRTCHEYGRTHSLKVVVAQCAVVPAGTQATVFEICGRIRTGRDLADRAFRSVLCCRGQRGRRV